jgi:hypothetical protein
VTQLLILSIESLRVRLGDDVVKLAPLRRADRGWKTELHGRDDSNRPGCLIPPPVVLRRKGRWLGAAAEATAPGGVRQRGDDGGSCADQLNDLLAVVVGNPDIAGAIDGGVQGIAEIAAAKLVVRRRRDGGAAVGEFRDAAAAAIGDPDIAQAVDGGGEGLVEASPCGTAGEGIDRHLVISIVDGDLVYLVTIFFADPCGRVGIDANGLRIRARPQTDRKVWRSRAGGGEATEDAAVLIRSPHLLRSVDGEVIVGIAARNAGVGGREGRVGRVAHRAGEFVDVELRGGADEVEVAVAINGRGGHCAVVGGSVIL